MKLLYITSFFNLSYKPIGQRIQHFKSYFLSKADLFFIGNKHIDTISSHVKSSSVLFHLFTLLGKFVEVTRFEAFCIKVKTLLRLLLHNESYDVIYVQIRPFSFCVLCSFFKRLFPNATLCLEMTDPMSINVNFSNYSKIRQRQLLRYERQLHYLDYLIVLNNEIGVFYRRSVPNGKVLVIEQGVDDYLLDSIPDIPNSRNTSSPSLIYAGSFYSGIREPFELYKAIASSTDAILDIFGNIKEPYLIDNERVHFKGIESQQNIYLSYQNYRFVVYIDNDSLYQVPGKLFEVLSTNKAILFITNNISSPSSRIASSYGGVFFTLNESHDIADIIEKKDVESKYYRNTDNFRWSALLSRLDFLFKNNEKSFN